MTIALIGRTNVGKSTLFNRMVGESRAIVSELPHTTRDRNVGTTAWRGVELRVIDTGGIEEGRGKREEGRGIEHEIRRQVELAIGDADILVLVTDVREGVLPGEQRISQYLRRLGKPIIVACNKASTERRRLACQEFSALGLGEVSPIAAITGAGVGDLLDRIVVSHPPTPPLQGMGGKKKNFSPSTAVEGSACPPLAGEGEGELLVTRHSSLVTRIAIVGEPNVGKSSLLNAILGREEVIVLPEPFTTRDVHDVELEVGGRTITLLDTAGIRRLAVRAVWTSRTRIEEIERLAVRRSLAAIERSDVTILVLDATRAASKHTKQLAAAIIDAGRACVIVVNKTDLIPPLPPSVGPEEHERVTRRGGPPPRAVERARWGSAAAGPASAPPITATIHHLFPHLSWAPVLATSATKGTNVPNIVPAAIQSAENWRRRLEPNELAAVHAIVKHHIPMAKTSFGRKRSHVIELRQTDTTPPWFLLLSRKRIKLPKAIPAIVERALREHADFEGTPIRITIKSVKA